MAPTRRVQTAKACGVGHNSHLERATVACIVGHNSQLERGTLAVAVASETWPIVDNRFPLPLPAAVAPVTTPNTSAAWTLRSCSSGARPLVVLAAVLLLLLVVLVLAGPLWASWALAAV